MAEELQLDETCFIVDDPYSPPLMGPHPDVICYNSFDCDPTRGKTATLNLPRVAFIPDASTHLANDAVTVFPGDVEVVQVVVTDAPADATVTYSLLDPSVASFLVGGQPTSQIVTTSTSVFLDVAGLAEGVTQISVDVEGLCVQYFPVHVGGAIEISYTQAPTFEPYYDPNGDTGTPGRAPPSLEVFNSAIQFEPRACTMLVTVTDARGDPKPGKAVQIVSRNGYLHITERSLFYSDTEGQIVAGIETQPFNIPQTPHTQGVVMDELAFLVGRTAELYDGQDPSVLDPIFADQMFYIHTFTGNRLIFSDQILGDGTMGYLTGFGVKMPILNEMDLVLLETHLEGRPFGYAPDGWVDFSVLNLLLWDSNSQSYLNTPAGPEEFILSGTPDYLTYQPTFDSLMKPSLQSDFLSMHGIIYDYTFEIAPAPDNTPGGRPKIVTVAAIAAEFGLAFIPGYDLVDVIRYGLWRNVAGDGPTTGNYVIAVVALGGLVADAGYLFGPTGFATNAVGSAIKIIVKHIPPELVKALLRMSDNAVSSIRLLAEYLQKYPKPDNFAWNNLGMVKNWAIDMTAGTINQWTRVLGSPIGLSSSNLANSVEILGRRASRTYSDEAAEGAAYAVKLGHGSVVDNLYGDFAEDFIEHSFEVAQRLGRNVPSDTYSAGAVRGFAVASEAATDPAIVKQFAEGTALTIARADLGFANLERLRGVDGLDDMVQFFRNNRNNGNGIDGVIFESTVARRILDGEVPGSGSLQRVSHDGLPNANRIDTTTDTKAIQIKHKRADVNFTPSDFGGSRAAAEQYLDDLALQANAIGLIPTVLTNRGINADLTQMLNSRNILWSQVAD